MQRTLCRLSAMLLLASLLPMHVGARANVPQSARRKGATRDMACKISPNGRFLVNADGTPFFYLADTAWELFHRLTREEADHYLATRARQGFTVIQAVVLAEVDGLHTPNPYGHLPLHDDDPTRPNEAYFQHVDYIVEQAAAHGLVIGMLPTWGDKWNKKWGVGPEIFTSDNARIYGEWLARRYKDRPILWILGGDRPVETDAHRAIIRAMAEGLRKGDGGSHLITFHPDGGRNSSQWFHTEPWLDFNMWQNGHGSDVAVWERIQADYNRTPTKPTMDGEPLYEDHPIGFKRDQFGTSLAADVRKFLYWNLFSGAHGHTYGNHSVWQMYTPERPPINGPIYSWRTALERPGANQMHHARALLESRPFLTRIPDPTLIVSDVGAGGKRIVATRDSEGSYLMVYTPASRPFTVNVEKLTGNRFRAHWFDPRTGKATRIGEQARPADNHLPFTPPNEGENQDWILVLDDATRNFPAPGQK